MEQTITNKATDYKKNQSFIESNGNVISLPVADKGLREWERRERPKIAVCVLTAGTLTAGNLLYRIRFWAPYTKIIRENRYWIAKTKASWCHETALSPKQFRVARERLEKIGLIQVRHWRFAGFRTTHISLVEERLPLELQWSKPAKKGNTW